MELSYQYLPGINWDGLKIGWQQIPHFFVSPLLEQVLQLITRNIEALKKQLESLEDESLYHRFQRTTDSSGLRAPGLNSVPTV